MNRKIVLPVGLCLLVALAACGGGGGGEPTAVAVVDSVATSVRQTVEAIAVAQTVAALTTPQDGATPQATAPQATAPGEQPTATVAAVATAQPTAVVLPSPTLAPPLPTSTAVPTVAPPTIAPPTATPTKAPPNIQNDAPGGSFPEDGSVFFNIIVDPSFLFRMDVRDLVPDLGNFEGVGIESVGFSISGNGIDYFREERQAGFCVFGGGEPGCNPWPVNEHGQYTRGEGGPVVQSGDYFVNMAVTAHDTSDEFGGNWNWNFNFTVTVP